VKYVDENYVDPQLIDPKLMVIEALNAVQRSVPEVLSFATDDGNEVALTVNGKRRTFPLGELKGVEETIPLLSEAYRFLLDEIGSELESREELEYTLIRGLLSTLDPHSVLLTPEFYKEMQINTTGKFGGLGIVISIRDGKLTIMSPIDGTPAQRAGLQARDVIVKIEDESTINMSLTDAVGKMRGDPGTRITITVLREGWTEPKPITLVREIINIKSIQSRLLSDGILYLGIKNFQKQTASDLIAAALKAQKDSKLPLQGYLLDLRNNPGGLLDQAVEVSDAFLEDGVVVTTISSKNKYREQERAKKDQTLSRLPMIVLINGGSASGSEIVAGALKNNDRAMVLGSHSFGKGTVQTIVNLEEDIGLKLTIAKYLTPGNRSIQSVGIVPDIFLIRGMLGEDRIDLFWNEEKVQEEDLKRHFEREIPMTEEEKPRYTVTYLSEDKGKDEAEFRSESLAEDLEKTDQEVRIAKELLLAALGPEIDRKRMLERIGSSIEGVRKREDERISAELKIRGIDWSFAALPPKGTHSIKIVVTAPDPIQAGSEVLLQFQVTNQGKETIYQFRAISTSEFYVFDDHEILFGRIEPGKTAAQRLKVKIPQNAPTLLEEMALRFEDQFGTSYPEERVQLKVKEIGQPHFAYHLEVTDERGNGDGLVQLGEPLEVHLCVRNDGRGEAPEVVAALVNKSGRGVFLNRGRLSLGAIPIGQERCGEFDLTTQEGLKDQHFEFDIKIVDSNLGEFIQGNHRIDMLPPRSLKKMQAVVELRKGEQPGSLYSGADSRSQVLGTLPAGKRLRTKAEDGEFYKVVLPEGGVAFVPRTEAQPIKNGETGAAVKYTYITSPTIRFTELDPYRIVATSNFLLKGEVEALEPVRDLYLYCGERKVHYERFGERTKATFQSEVPLEEGSNRITVFARNADKVTGSTSIFLYQHRPTPITKTEKPLASDNPLVPIVEIQKN